MVYLCSGIIIYLWYLDLYTYVSGWIGYFSNERGFSAQSSLQRISSNFFLKTKRFVCSSVNVILMRQTCGQRSSWAVESKRRAPDNYFPEWIAISFQSQNVKETEISVGALFGYLQKKNCCTMPISNFFCGRNMFFSEVVIAQRFSFRKYPKSARPRC